LNVYINNGIATIINYLLTTRYKI